MLAALLLAARALVRGTSAEATDLEPHASVTADAGGDPGLTEGIADPTSPSASSASCCPAVSSEDEVAEYSAGKDAVFLILPGDRPDTARTVTNRVEAVVRALAAQGKRVEALTLGPDAPGYGALVEGAAVRSFPSVVALGPSGQLSGVEGEITEDGLLRAFVEATVPRSSCDTPCGAPGACAN